MKMKNKYSNINNEILENIFYKTYFDKIVNEVRSLENDDYNNWLFECPEIWNFADAVTGFNNDEKLKKYILEGLLPMVDKHRFIYSTTKGKKFKPLFYTTDDNEKYEFQAFYDFVFGVVTIVYNHKDYGYLVKHEKINYVDVMGLDEDLFEPLNLNDFDVNGLITKNIAVFTEKGKQSVNIRTVKSMNVFEHIRAIAIYIGMNNYDSFEGFTYDDVYVERGVIL